MFAHNDRRIAHGVRAADGAPHHGNRCITRVMIAIENLMEGVEGGGRGLGTYMYMYMYM